MAVLAGLQIFLAGFLLYHMAGARAIGYAWGAMLFGAMVGMIGLYLLNLIKLEDKD